MDFEVLILGSDINAYYMARCYNEEYNKKAYMIGKVSMNFTDYSKIINLTIEPKLQENSTFTSILKDFYEAHKNTKILLIPTNDNYVRLVIENQEFLSKYFVFHKYSVDVLNSFLIKELFYTKYPSLDIPKTLCFNINEKIDFIKLKEFGYPFILKPSDGIMYHNHEFANQHKVYKILDERQLAFALDDIRKSGYTGNLIIQEFIEGDDSYLFDCIAYVDRMGSVKLMTFAQIALQEHTITGIGNATVVVNGCNLFGNTKETVDKLKTFIEQTGYRGFCEFDLKYDIKDSKFKVLEINPRQARCSYYLSYCGYNLVKYLVDDLIYKIDLEYQFVDKQVCLSFVPRNVINKYVMNEGLKRIIYDLYKQNKVVNPLNYNKDNLFKRKLWLCLRSYNYKKKYKKNSW